MTAWLVVVAIASLPVFWAVGACKRLVGLRSGFRNAFLEVSAQSKRRHDLVPYLLVIVPNYLMHQRRALDDVTAARNQAFTAGVLAAHDPTDTAALQRMAAAEAALGASLEQMLSLSHASAALWADRGMLSCTRDLRGTESRLVFAQQDYNDSVGQYNRAITQFPGSLLASMLGFRRAAPLQATRSADDRRGKGRMPLRQRS